MTSLSLIATSTFGLEAVVARELQALGYEAKPGDTGRIHFRGDLSAICRANLWLRAADRVLVRIGEFDAKDFGELFDQTNALPWEQWIGKDGAFPVKGRSVRSQLSSVPACQKIVKKAIVERLRRAHRVADLPETGATYQVEVSLLKDRVTLTLDTSGAGLHKRGYRMLVGEAALRETMAAALVKLTYWRPDRPLIDPFCGTGTIPIEAALIGRNIAPGRNRSFAAEQWQDMDADRWRLAREEARDLEVRDQSLSIAGTDIDERALDQARTHAREAGVEDAIHFQRRSFQDLRSRWSYGVVIGNPPYGERIGERDEVEELYRSMPEVLRRLKTWSHYIITSHPGLEELVGRPADRRRKLYNARIECTYYQFHGPRPPRRGEGDPQPAGGMIESSPESEFAAVAAVSPPSVAAPSEEARSSIVARAGEAIPAASPPAGETSPPRGDEGTPAASPRAGETNPTSVPRAEDTIPAAPRAADATSSSSAPADVTPPSRPPAIVDEPPLASSPSHELPGAASPVGREEDEVGAEDDDRESIAADPSAGPSVRRDPRVVASAFGGLTEKAFQQAELFKNRLLKRARHLRRWPTKRGITCYRLYERDVPEIPLVVDRYEDCLHITEYERPHDRGPAEHADWLDLMAASASEVLGVKKRDTFLKRRGRQRGREQHSVVANDRRTYVVSEGDLKFEVNLSDYVDTGLFLDHRQTRAMVRERSRDKRVMNLFCYTGSFTVYAAAGGAMETVSVDLSGNYLDWAERNLQLNGLYSPAHHLVQSDVREFLADLEPDDLFDIIVIDPPTFSNSKSLDDVFEVRRDYGELLELSLPHLTATGQLFFSTNFRRIKFEQSRVPPRFQVREISDQTVPEDFRNKKIHRCWRIERDPAIGGED